MGIIFCESQNTKFKKKKRSDVFVLADICTKYANPVECFDRYILQIKPSNALQMRLTQ